MRLYRKVKPLAEGTTAGKKNKAVLFINPDTTDSVINVSVKNSDGTIEITEMFLKGTSFMTSSTSPVNYFIYPFSIQSWSLVSGRVNAYELY